MALKDIKGNQIIADRMMMAVRNKNVSHAYILEGDSHIDKMEIANNFIKAILCGSENGDGCDVCLTCQKVDHGNHEDVIYLKLEGASIKDEAIEELQGRMKKKPYVGDRTIVVIQNADTMTLRAQNRLLKTLEEPSKGTVILLLSENIENLVETILSRCVIFKLNAAPSGLNSDGIEEEAAAIANMLLDRRPFYAVSARMEEFSSSKEKTIAFLDALEQWYRDFAVCQYDSSRVLLYQEERYHDFITKSRKYSVKNVGRAVASIEEARNSIMRNMNINYCLKNMILNMIA